MSNKPITTRKPSIAAVTATVIAVIAWLCNYYFLVDLDKDIRGTFGDMFGAVNSAFSGLAFIGVVYAIFLQRHEIDIARTEITYTKTILDEQQKQLKLQNQETKRQIFENTFFQLLRLFTDLVTQIDIRRANPIKGKDVFPYFISRLHSKYERVKKENNGIPNFNAAYEEFYKDNGAELGHYFRTIYNIVKFIDNSEIDNKKFYSNILRAQLSNPEAIMLFYNGMSVYGSHKFKPYIEKYALLKNVGRDDIFEFELMKNYTPSAFGFGVYSSNESAQ